MDGARRQPAPDLISDLEENAPRYAFFRAVEILLAHKGYEIEERALHRQEAEGIRFRVDPGLGFPAADLVSVRETGTSEAPVHELTVNFLGLHGTSAPLPAYMLETAAWSVGEEGVQQTFNDFFSNRLIWLFYLVWRKYRYHIRYRPGATDQFSDWMFSLIGIGSQELRGTAGIPWAKLLTYLGVLAARTRSAEMISGVIAHAFALPSVRIRELELRQVEIPEDQRVRVGVMNASLGHDMVIGDRVRDVAGKFTVVLQNLDFQRFRDFLPSGKDYGRLRELVEFLLKDQFAYDLELHLTTRETPKFVLGDPKKGLLGWTTFIGETPPSGPEPIVLQARA